jgi:hypothetical protein
MLILGLSASLETTEIIVVAYCRKKVCGERVPRRVNQQSRSWHGLRGDPRPNPPRPEPEQTPKWEAPGRERRQVGTKTRCMRGGGSVGVLVGVTPHRGARESRVQGEAPKSGGSRSRAISRMQIWGNAPGEAGERRADRSPPGVSRGMVKAICPVLTGRMGKRTW